MRLHRSLPGKLNPIRPLITIGLCAVLLLASESSVAASGPRPPCATTPLPAYPDPDNLPIVQVWTDNELEPDYAPAGCTGWLPTAFRTLAATAGRFRHQGRVEDLLARFAAVSALRTIRYWSVWDKRWENLVVDASALSGPDATLPRADFRVDELAAGADVYFAQTDNRSTATVVYRMRVRAIGPDRLVVETENVSAVRYLLLPLAAAGDLQVLYFLERQASDEWGYYSLARVAARTSSLLGGHEASFINRAVALFRYTAAMPTDQEPPAVP